MSLAICEMKMSGIFASRPISVMEMRRKERQSARFSWYFYDVCSSFLTALSWQLFLTLSDELVGGKNLLKKVLKTSPKCPSLKFLGRIVLRSCTSNLRHFGAQIIVKSTLWIHSCNGSFAFNSNFVKRKWFQK